jgi:hypothetical protein
MQTSAATAPTLPPERSLLRRPDGGPFGPADLDGLPDPVRRYLGAAIALGTPLARTAQLQMQGTIRIGRWVPFRARELLAPLDGFVWTARAAGVVTGSDRYLDGTGVADWHLAGLLPVMHAAGPDVSRSAAGRAGGEGVWLPTALLPRYGVRWTAEGRDRITAQYLAGGVPLRLRLRLDEAGRAASFVFHRWGDPDRTGTWAWHPFGGEVTGHRTFGGVTIPAAGRIGWLFGTDRWPDGEFFRFRITDLHLVTGAEKPVPRERGRPPVLRHRTRRHPGDEPR